MKRLNLCLLTALILMLLPAQTLAAPAAPHAPDKHWRESVLVVIDAPSGPDKTTTSTSWSDVPDMVGAFNVRYVSDVAMTFCAEADVTNNKRMFVRALVDGAVASPSDVVFAVGWTTDTHCFTFVWQGIATGTHAVRIQWLVDGGGEGHIGDRSLTITASHSNADDLRLLAVAAPSGPDKTTTSNSWTDIPNLSGTLTLPAASDIAVTLSAEAESTAGKRVFVRALVDGQVASPSDQIFVVGGWTGTRAITFVYRNVAAGSHSIRVQWLVDGGGTGYLGDRTLTAVGVHRYGSKYAGRLMQAAPSGPDKTTTSTSWVDVPDLSGTLHVPATGDVAITFSGEINATSSKRVFLRVLFDGQATSPGDVVVVTGGFSGTYAFTFVKKNVGWGSHTVKVQWLVDGGGTAYVGDRAVSAYSYALGTGISISYAVKVKGYNTWVIGQDGSNAGTIGQQLPLEAVTLDLIGAPAGATIRYRVHMQGQGWMAWVNENQTAGLPGSGLRMEAIEVQLINWPADWQLQYDAHVQSYGWQGWIDAPYTAGTVGQGLRIESLRFQVAPAGVIQEVIYNVHVQQIGWVGWRHQGDLAGTVAQSRRIEAFQAILTGLPSTWIEYQAWVEGVGWTAWTAGPGTVGTVGQSRRLESIRIRLQNAPSGMRVCYRAYMQGEGWNAWVCDGATAGHPGQGKRMEAIQIYIE